MIYYDHPKNLPLYDTPRSEAVLSGVTRGRVPQVLETLTEAASTFFKLSRYSKRYFTESGATAWAIGDISGMALGPSYSGSFHETLGCLYTANSTWGRAGVMCRMTGTGNTPTMYALEYDDNAGQFQVCKYIAGVRTQLGVIAKTRLNFYWCFRLRVSGASPNNSISAKAWDLSTTEPTAWDWTGTDASAIDSGRGGASMYHGLNTTNPNITCGFLACSYNSVAEPIPMPKSVAEIDAWAVNDSQQRVVLVEAGVLTTSDGSTGLSGKVCLSTVPFITDGGDDPPNTVYDDILTEAPTLNVTTTEAFFGRSQIAYGDMTISNEDGARDDWLTWNWDGRPLVVYVGGLGWKRWDFERVMTATVESVYAKSLNAIGFKVRGKDALMKSMFQTTLVSGSTKKVPYVNGRVFNMEPPSYDAATLKFMIGEGSVSTIDQVRDGGGSVAFTNLGGSPTLFSLSAARTGQITADINGASTIPHSTLLTSLTYKLGLTGGTDWYQGSEVGGLNNFVNTTPAGLCVQGDESKADVLDMVTSSGGGFWYFDRQGCLRAVQLTMPTGSETPNHTLLEDDVVKDSFRVERIILPCVKYDIFGRKNHTIQTSGFVGAVSEADKVTYGAVGEISAWSPSDTGLDIPANHAMARTVPNRVSLFASAADAAAEAQRQYAIFKTMTAIVTFDVVTSVPRFLPGELLSLTHSRYGFSAGRMGQIVGVQDDPSKGICRIKLFVRVTGQFPLTDPSYKVVGAEYFY